MSEIKNNISIDYGNLLITDSSNYKNLTESKINTALKQNYIKKEDIGKKYLIKFIILTA